MTNPAFEMNHSFAAAIAAAAPSVVRVGTDRGRSFSGLVWDDQGTILTSHRVAGPCTSLEVTTAEGEGFEVELAGSDPGTGVAALRAPGRGLPPIARHAADDLAVGHVVLALGRPGRTVRASLRIIGALARDVATEWGGRLERYVETDRGFPRGFAGGPLIDLEGRLIGLDTPWVIRGADLAIPIETLERVSRDLLSHGAVERGYLGVGVQTVGLPAGLAATQRSGALVVSVDPDSPAARSGLVFGDVLVELDGHAVRGPDELRLLLADRAGRTVEVGLLRGGARITLELAIGGRR